MKHLHWLVVLFVFIGIGGLQGCDKSNDRNRVQEAPDLPRGDGNLYVANAGTGSLLAFDTALSAEGDLSPDRHFPETVAGPAGLFLDQTADTATLYVANTGQNAVLIYEDARAFEPPIGSASATRVISGPKTRLNRPVAVAYSPALQRLYVANRGDVSILVFQPGCSGAVLLNGDIAPCQVISGAATLLASPGALALDPGHLADKPDLLYVANGGTGTILIFENAAGSSPLGEIPPTRTLPLVASPADLYLDSTNDRLYVIQGAGEGQAAILVYEDASTRSGPSSADQILTGPETLLASPAGISVDTTQNVIYIVNNNHSEEGDSALLIYSDPLTGCETCNVAPAQVITGNQTGLNNPAGIAVDLQFERIYVANGSNDEILSFGMEGNIPTTKINTGTAALLGWPISFFYDSEEDRLYVLNNRAFLSGPNAPMIGVYEAVSTTPWDNTPPDWGILRGSILSPREIYVDKTRNRLLLLLNANELRVYNLGDIIPNPLSGNHALPTTPVATFTTGLSGPLSMSVDEERGLAYVGNDNLNGIAVYDLETLNATPRTIAGSNTGLVRPFGLFVDPEKDILYAVQTESNNILSFDNASTIQGNTAPNRVLTSSSAPLTDRLNAPTAPYMNVAKNRLFLINRGNDSVYIFDNASTLDGEVLPDRKLVGENTEIRFPPQPFDSPITGALWVDTRRGGERIFLGGPIQPACALPLNQCPAGVLLLFSMQGNLAPGQIWSGGENRLVGPSAIAVDPRRDLLYVANQGDPAATSDDSISLFTNASRSDGSLPLSGTVSVTEGISTVTGTGTAFNSELMLGDRIKIGTATLMVSSISSDTSLSLVTPYPEETVSGQIAVRLPRIVCSPSGTACASPDAKLNNPAGLAVDHDQNRLYVSNSGASDCSDATPCNSLLIFHAPSSFTSNAAPDYVITNNTLNSPRGLALDSERGVLYVANHGNNSILAFRLEENEKEECREKQERREIDAGQPAFLECMKEELGKPDAEIAGAAAGIAGPIGVAIDWAEDILYVLNEGSPEILVFEQASTLNGDRAPARTFSGGASYQSPSALFLDVEGDLLYVADREENEVYIFMDASRAEGEAAHKTISGDQTGLDQPTGLAVDTAR